MTLFKAKLFSLEMGFSRQDFLTLLNSQDKLLYSHEGELIVFSFANQSVDISLGEESIRHFGSAKLPMLPVTFDFSNMGDNEQEEFMTLFLLKFQRGGG
ncbi:MAG: hypothetical protein V2J13_06265 [Cycloclasticus sp.]|jgi:hypothetical protein|nr:hypothetical protein [Cycloclasticus sp.]MEE4291330.1 hypothetical protein [Cycloclasticus sp.]